MFNSSHFIVACFCFILLLLLPLAAASPDEWADGIKSASKKPPIKVLLLGNSGVGKSMLLNAIQKPITGKSFESKFNDGAVTKKTEMIEYVHTDGQKYLMYNIPGLLDVDESVTKENAAEIEKAFRDQSDVPVVTLFVLTTEAGRLKPQDLEAWNAITRYVPDINDKSSVAFLVNKIDYDQLRDSDARMLYEVSMTRMLQNCTNSTFGIYFLPQLTAEEAKTPEVRLRTKLLSIVLYLQGKTLEVPEGAQLKLKTELFNEEIAKMTKRLDDIGAASKADAEKREQKYLDEVEEVKRKMSQQHEKEKQERDREMEALRSRLNDHESSGDYKGWQIVNQLITTLSDSYVKLRSLKL